jgi:hypothetical protein
MTEDSAGGLDSILAQLPAKTPLLVPDELLGVWFPPGVIEGRISESSFTAASAYAEKCNCTFDYSADEQCGRFWKRKYTN